MIVQSRAAGVHGALGTCAGKQSPLRRDSDGMTRVGLGKRPNDTVIVVDDDPSVLRSLERLFLSEGYAVETFQDPQQLLAAPTIENASCAVLDLVMDHLSGLDLLDEFNRRDYILPAVFISAHGDVPVTVKAMKAGAVDFLTKPYDEDVLLGAVKNAIKRGRDKRKRRDAQLRARTICEVLTPREMEVARLVAEGMLSKQIAIDLGIAEKTVTIHRGQVMHKLGLESVADLVRLIDLLDEASEVEFVGG